MQTKNQDIINLIEKMGEHYRQNVATVYLRPAFFRLDLKRDDWDRIENLTEKNAIYRQQGYHLDELYVWILSFARFVNRARRQILPDARGIALGALRETGADKKIKAEMAAANFSSNLGVLGAMLLELLDRVKIEDELNAHGKPAIWKKEAAVPEILELLAP